MALATSFGASKRREAIRTAGAEPLKRGVKRGGGDDAPFPAPQSPGSHSPSQCAPAMTAMMSFPAPRSCETGKVNRR
jgi:hypothetical protein